jgi:hypothetical protein
MRVLRRALGVIAVICLSAEAAPPVQGVGHAPAPAAAVAVPGGALSADARHVAQWIAESRDNEGKPFVIVDKKEAKVFVFSARGTLLGAAPALLGMARGDHAVPGIGALHPSRIPHADRTTPAGRFEAEAGTNLDGDDVIWIDYDAGLAIHRVRADAAQQVRLRRLAANQPEAHRVSAGCVVLPVSFYDSVLRPALSKGRGVVYVLPEMRPVRDVFAPRAADL